VVEGYDAHWCWEDDFLLFFSSCDLPYEELLDDAFFLVCMLQAHDDLEYLEKRVYVAFMVYRIHDFSCSSACCVLCSVRLTLFMS
jgi:hypothetical protein